MPRVIHVKKARKARPEYGIAVGDSYYWWRTQQRQALLEGLPARLTAHDVGIPGRCVRATRAY